MIPGWPRLGVALGDALVARVEPLLEAFGRLAGTNEEKEVEDDGEFEDDVEDEVEEDVDEEVGEEAGYVLHEVENEAEGSPRGRPPWGMGGG